jgi:hypothetical protein
MAWVVGALVDVIAAAFSLNEAFVADTFRFVAHLEVRAVGV